MLFPEKRYLIKTGVVDYYDWCYTFPIRFVVRYRYYTIVKLLGRIKYPRLLEVGTGSGIFLPELARHCDELYASDIHNQFESIENLLKVYKITNFHLSTQSIEKTNYPDNHFDAIVAVSVLEFVDNLPQAIHEIKRILKTDGVFITICPMDSRLLDRFLSIFTDKPPKEEFGDSRKYVGKSLEESFTIISRGYMIPLVGKFFPVYTHYILKK